MNRDLYPAACISIAAALVTVAAAMLSVAWRWL